MTGIHDSLTVIDGLVISKWSRAVFADIRKGGLTAANCTCSIWEELGVGVVQITYNTQNLAGSGCYERRDTGLSGFGHEVVTEMNRVGILCDLSHIGAVTSREVILASKRPAAYTHILAILPEIGLSCRNRRLVRPF